MPDVTLVSPEGDATTVSGDRAAALRLKGYRDEGEEQAISRVGLQTRKANASTADTIAGAGFDAATGGLLSTFDENARIRAEQLQEAHPTAFTAATVGGVAVPMAFGVGDAAIGNLFREPLALERAGSALSSKMLYAGEVGSEAGSAAKLAERGLVRGSAELNEAGKVTSLPVDLTTLDAPGLRADHAAELDRLATAHGADRTAARSAVVDDLTQYRADLDAANPYLATGEGSAAQDFVTSSKTLKGAFKDIEGLRENPSSVLKPLRQQAQAIETTIAERESIAAELQATNTKIATRVGADFAALPAEATELELSGKAARRYADYADVPLKKNASITVPRAEVGDFVSALHNGQIAGEAESSLGKLEGILENNRALRSKIKAAMASTPKAELTSERITANLAAQDALKTSGKRSLAEDMLGGTIMGHVAGAFSGLPIIGPMIGAKLGRVASDLVFSRMGKAVGEAALKSKSAAQAFLNVATRSPAVPVLASRVLAHVAYGPSQGEPTGNDLASLFKARTDEVKQQTAYGLDGKPVMRMAARQAMAQRLDPVRAADPIAADQLETLGARRLEFLSSKIPRRPNIAGIPIGPDMWKPSDMEMRKWARYVHAVEDPHGVEQRLAAGALSPEDVEAYKAVYPERHAALVQAIMAGLPNRTKPLPYAQRLSLSMFVGQPVDPSLDPTVIKVFQSQFENKDDNADGAVKPTPKPQFGSVKSDLGTLSEQRESGSR